MTLQLNREQFNIKLHCAERGYHDYTIVDHPTLRRACVPTDIRIGDTFNVYHGESSKSGALWLGDLEESLVGWLNDQLKTAVDSASATRIHGIKISVPELFGCADFQAYVNTSSVMTWHDKKGPIERDSYSDVVVFVDPSMSGEGSDSDMPGWDLVVEKLKSVVGSEPFHGNHLVVVLSNC